MRRKRSFGEVFRARRLQRRWSLREFERASGVSDSSCVRLQTNTGLASLKFSTCQKIAKALDWPLADLTARIARELEFQAEQRKEMPRAQEQDADPA